jgi:hypothetical protein
LAAISIFYCQSLKIQVWCLSLAFGDGMGWQPGLATLCLLLKLCQGKERSAGHQLALSGLESVGLGV